MPILSLRDNDLRQQLGLFTETMLERSQNRKNGQEHRDRARARHEIVHALYSAKKPLSRLDIARAIRRAKTPHLVDIIEELVAEGILERSVMQWRNVWMYVYEVNSDAAARIVA